jgi:hypothetical protein
VNRTRLATAVLLAFVSLQISSSAREHQQISMPGYPAIGGPAIVKLITPGAEPRRAMRYSVPAGYKGLMTMKMSMEMSSAALPMALPPIGMEMGVDIALVSVAPSGDMTVSMTIAKAAVDSTVDPTIAGAMQAGLAGIVGLKGTAVMTNRGVTKSVNLDLDKIKDPAMSQALSQVSQSVENMLAPFPEEPLGVGARWAALTATNANGMSMFTRTEYELTAVTASSMTLRVKTEATAPQQNIVNPALPAEVQMTLESLKSTGTGTGTVPLNSLIPTMTTDMTMAMSMIINAAGQTLPMSMDLKMKMSTAPGK